MSKSLGNIETVHELVAKHPPEALRYALLSGHITRKPLDWSEALIAQSVRTLNRLWWDAARFGGVSGTRHQSPGNIEAALDDDLEHAAGAGRSWRRWQTRHASNWLTPHITQQPRSLPRSPG